MEKGRIVWQSQWHRLRLVCVGDDLFAEIYDGTDRVGNERFRADPWTDSFYHAIKDLLTGKPPVEIHGGAIRVLVKNENGDSKVYVEELKCTDMLRNENWYDVPEELCLPAIKSAIIQLTKAPVARTTKVPGRGEKI